MGAYYSRNNSYSRSYNASNAEADERFPLTRAARFLGISVKAFKSGCEYAKYTTSEWHHVGKYANRVDYYDTKELAADPKFWKGASTKLNKSFVEIEYKKALKEKANEKLSEMKFLYKFQNKGYSKDYDGEISIFENVINVDRVISHIIRSVGAERLQKKREFEKQTIEYNRNLHRKIALHLDGRVYSRSQSCNITEPIDWENYEVNSDLIAAFNDKVYFSRK